jgi:hypothetical protein
VVLKLNVMCELTQIVEIGLELLVMSLCYQEDVDPFIHCNLKRVCWKEGMAFLFGLGWIGLR